MPSWGVSWNWYINLRRTDILLFSVPNCKFNPFTSSSLCYCLLPHTVMNSSLKCCDFCFKHLLSFQKLREEEGSFMSPHIFTFSVGSIFHSGTLWWCWDVLSKSRGQLFMHSSPLLCSQSDGRGHSCLLSGFMGKALRMPRLIILLVILLWLSGLSIKM